MQSSSQFPVCCGHVLLSSIHCCLTGRLKNRRISRAGMSAARYAVKLWQSAGARRGVTMRRSVAAMPALALACLVAPASTLAQHAYITNEGSSTVSVISTATNTVTGIPIPVGSLPIGVAVTPDGSRVYVANQGAVEGVGTVSVISTATNTVTGIPIPVGSYPFGLAVTPDGSKVYVTNAVYATGTVSVISTATNTVTGIPISVGRAPVGVAVTPDGSKVYVANRNDGTVSMISKA